MRVGAVVSCGGWRGIAAFKYQFRPVARRIYEILWYLMMNLRDFSDVRYGIKKIRSSAIKWYRFWQRRCR